jgi:hypothetical protein
MINDAAGRLQYLTEIIPPLLHAIDDAEFSAKPALNKWSKKEIIGHLIDSASNNHHRFIRGQFENIPSINYNQDKWNESGHYQKINKDLLIKLWAAYNEFLCQLISLIPVQKLQSEVNTGDNKICTIEFLIHDYVVHLEHHLRQVASY